MDFWENELIDRISLLQWNFIVLYNRWVIWKKLKDQRVKELESYKWAIEEIIEKTQTLETEFYTLNKIQKWQ